jgi:hypothetical protein
MKFHTLGLTAMLAVTPIAFAVGDKHEHAAKHGGIAVETKNAGLEIVARPDLIQIYVDDHGKPVTLEGAKAKVTLLNGSEKSDVELTVAGDRLEAKGSYKVAKGTKGVVVVTLAGKPALTARFQVK